MTQQLHWDEAVGRLRSRVSPQNYDMWLRPIELKSWDGATVRLRAPNSYVRLWFESNFLTSLVKELRDLGHDDVAVVFEPDGEDRQPAPAPEPIELAVGSAPTREVVQVVEPAPEPEAFPAPDAASLNPRYTFDTFVAGPSNQLAFAASQ